MPTERTRSSIPIPRRKASSGGSLSSSGSGTKGLLSTIKGSLIPKKIEKTPPHTSANSRESLTQRRFSERQTSGRSNAKSLGDASWQNVLGMREQKQRERTERQQVQAQAQQPQRELPPSSLNTNLPTEQGLFRMRNFSLPCSIKVPSERSPSVETSGTSCTSESLPFILDELPVESPKVEPPPKSPFRRLPGSTPQLTLQPAPRRFPLTNAAQKRRSSMLSPRFQPIAEVQSESDPDMMSVYSLGEDAVPELSHGSPSPISDRYGEEAWAKPIMAQQPGACGFCGHSLTMAKERQENLCTSCQREFQRQSIFLHEVEGMLPQDDAATFGRHSEESSPILPSLMEKTPFGESLQPALNRLSRDLKADMLAVRPAPDPRCSATFGTPASKQLASRLNRKSRHIPHSSQVCTPHPRTLRPA